MLVDIVFDLDKLNKEYADRGVTFTTKSDDSGTLYYQTIDPNHEFWTGKGHIPSSEPRPFVGRETLGVYWGWQLEDSIERLSESKLTGDTYGLINIKTGEYMPQSEWGKAFNRSDDMTDEEHRYLMGFNTGTYGSADNVQQVLDKYKSLIANPNTKVLFGFSTIKREDSEGGYRWHKNGEYIGTKNPTHEYLYDDTHIDEIVQFHVYVLK